MKREPIPASGRARCTPSGVAIVRRSSYSIARANHAWTDGGCGPLSPERFAAERGAAWEELEACLRRAGDRPEKLGRDGVRRLGTLYRAGAAALAVAPQAVPRGPAGGAPGGARAARAGDGLRTLGAARVAGGVLLARVLAAAGGAA